MKHTEKKYIITILLALSLNSPNSHFTIKVKCYVCWQKMLHNNNLCDKDSKRLFLQNSYLTTRGARGPPSPFDFCRCFNFNSLSHTRLRYWMAFPTGPKLPQSARVTCGGTSHHLSVLLRIYLCSPCNILLDASVFWVNSRGKSNNFKWGVEKRHLMGRLNVRARPRQCVSPTVCELSALKSVWEVATLQLSSPLFIFLRHV